MPVRARVQPGVQRHGPFVLAQGDDRAAQERERGSEIVLSGLGLRGARGAISSSYGTRPAEAARSERSPPTRDLERFVLQHLAEGTVALLQPRKLQGHLGRRFSEPDELRVTVRETRSGLPAFVDEQVGMRKAGRARSLAPPVPDGCDRCELVIGELGDRAHVPRRVDDDLLVLECRVEVRDDTHLPARRVGLAWSRRDREGLRRRAVLAALVEGALLELVRRGRIDRAALRARTTRPSRCDDDGSARERVVPKLWRSQLFCP